MLNVRLHIFNKMPVIFGFQYSKCGMVYYVCYDRLLVIKEKDVVLKSSCDKHSSIS